MVVPPHAQQLTVDGRRRAHVARLGPVDLRGCHVQRKLAMSFTDHFAAQASAYRTYRPDYPDALFAHLAGLVRRRDVAWDCGTGSGQAARGLAAYFARVVATDASAAQLAHAEPHERVEYRVARAEASGLDAHSVDVVTVAQALHWFDVDAFYAEARRVLRPGGVLAAWTYDDVELGDDRLDAIVRRFNHETLDAHWPLARALVRDRYRSLPFPFAELPAPAVMMERRWTLAELAGYLRTWSATARYVQAHGRDPVDAVEAELAPLWGPPGARRLARWPLTVRLGRADGAGEVRGTSDDVPSS